MSNYVWLCNCGDYSVANIYDIVIQTANYDGLERFWLERKESLGELNDTEQQKLESLQQQSYKFTNAWKEREFIDNLPIKLFKKPDMDSVNLPTNNEVFFQITNGYLVVNKKLYNVISKFNLGKTHFSQVYIYDIETKEQLSSVPYYFVNIAEKFEFLNSNESKGIRASCYSPEEPFRYMRGAEDDDILLLEQAQNTDIDLWHDKNLNDSLFFSDRLANELFNNGFTQKELGLIRCIVQ